MKCARLRLRKLREHVLSIKKELDLGIGKVRLTNRKSSKPVSVKEYSQIPSVYKSQEMWKRNASHGSCKISGRFLKNSNVEKLVVSVDEQTKCLYCGGGIFNDTTEWVQCDQCA